jgi:hypothetical protein
MNYSIVAIALLIVSSGAGIILSSSLFTKAKKEIFEKLKH